MTVSKMGNVSKGVTHYKSNTDIQNVEVVLWLQGKHAGYLCNSFKSWLRKMSLVYDN